MGLPKFEATEVMTLAKMFGQEQAYLERRLATSEEMGLTFGVRNAKDELKRLSVLSNKINCIELMGNEYTVNMFQYEQTNYFNILWGQLNGDTLNA